MVGEPRGLDGAQIPCETGSRQTLCTPVAVADDAIVRAAYHVHNLLQADAQVYDHQFRFLSHRTCKHLVLAPPENVFNEPLLVWSLARLCEAVTG